MKRHCIYSILMGLNLLMNYAALSAQTNPDQIYSNSIHTVLIHPKEHPVGLPFIGLNDTRPLEISFDDFTKNFQDYYYTIELRGLDWEPIAVSPFDYIQGFPQNKIYHYTPSSISTQPYIHYQFELPNENCKPTKSGNYIVKVFKGGEPDNILFTRRFFVADNIIGVFASVQEPFDGNISKTHQKIQLSLDVKKLPYFQMDQVQVCVFQNKQINDFKRATNPSFIRGSIIEYNSEQDLIFPAGKEYRWLDLQSLRLKTDRIAGFDFHEPRVKVILKPDMPRNSIPYYSFNDLNGSYIISNSESIEAPFQNDYAQVQFTYIPKDGIPYFGEKLFLIGAITNNELDKAAEMVFNAAKGVYEKNILLKQGYYSYQYLLKDNRENNSLMDFTLTEGDHWETENNYTILVYYTAAGARYPSLAGFSTINSKQNW